jgi:hypothetical protein
MIHILRKKRSGIKPGPIHTEVTVPWWGNRTLRYQFA